MQSRLAEVPRGVLFVIAGSFLMSVARAMSLTFVAIILLRDFSMSPMAIGFVLFLGPLLGAVVAPVVGAWSDHAGRKPVLALVFSALFASTFALGITNDWSVYCLAYTIAAIAIALFGPIARAIISDGATELSARLGYFSWRYTASNLGWVIGPVAGVLIGAATPAGFLIAGSIYALLLAILAVVDITRLHQPEIKAAKPGKMIADLRKTLSDRRLLYFVCGGVLAIAASGHWPATVGPYLSRIGLGPESFALFVSTNGLTVLLANPVARRFIARAGGRSGLLIGCMLLCASQIGFAIATGLPGLVTAMIALSIGEVFIVSSEYTLIDTIASASTKGSYFGAHALTSAGSFIGPILGGIMLTVLGGPAMFLFFGFASLASALLYLRGMRA